MHSAGFLPQVDLSAAILQPLDFDEYSPKPPIDLLRLDLVHPLISGNKWFKLRLYLQQARQQQKAGLLSFGGAWSNHLLACAAAARAHGLSSIGVLRGEAPAQPSATLLQARQLGMALHYLPRNEYAGLAKEEAAAYWSAKFPNHIIIPEGGAGTAGVEGASQIFDLLPNANYTHIVTAIGTGTTALGLLTASSASVSIIGIPVLKGFRQPEPAQIVAQLNEVDRMRLHLVTAFHFGGYARQTPELIAFMNQFYRRFGVPSDFVYTGKMFFALQSLVARQYFPESSRVLVLHSGGLQGNRSLPTGTLIF